MENCYHCGDEIVTKHETDNHQFCCNGCVSVYQIINNAGLTDYYNETGTPGINNKNNIYLDYLSSPEVASKLISYQDANRSVIKFVLPSIHCASCVWLLERLSLLSPNIISSQVNFLSKKITIHFNHNEMSLYDVGALLLSIGYEPKLDHSKRKKKVNHLIIRIGVAGFCFGNIMLLSFPEYLGDDPGLMWNKFFSMLSIFLSIPIVLYSAQPFYNGVYSALKAKKVSVDLLIVLGILALLGRSMFEIFHLGQGGYLDSLAGLIFFLLIGKWFQARVFSELSFEKENASYLPLAVLRKKEGEFKMTPIKEVHKGDEIRLRNGEVIPFKCVLKSTEATIDNSFITGEELPVHVKTGDVLYCGAQVQGNLIDVLVSDSTSEDLSDLWRDNKRSSDREEVTVNSKLIGYFTIFILLVAVGTFGYWSMYSFENAFLAATSVLIIACPCALALSAPIVYGIILRIYASRGLFVKSAQIVKKMSEVKSLIFDKTGTITNKRVDLKWVGVELSKNEYVAIGSIIRNSSHPLAVELGKKIKGVATISNYSEEVGEGLSATCNNEDYRIGTSVYVGTENIAGSTSIYVSKNSIVLGRFTLKLSIREGIEKLLKALNTTYSTYLLSGDENLVVKEYEHLFPTPYSIVKGASPEEKEAFLINKNKLAPSLMLGDGINDSLAFKHAHIGIAVVEETGSFFPSCDGIVKSDQLQELDSFINLAKYSKWVLLSCFLFSLSYNLVGLYYAVTLSLTPLFAAVLMPVSSVSVVLLAYLMLYSKRK